MAPTGRIFIKFISRLFEILSMEVSFVVYVRQGAVLPPIPQTNTTGEGYLIYPVG